VKHLSFSVLIKVAKILQLYLESFFLEASKFVEESCEDDPSEKLEDAGCYPDWIFTPLFE
jgi:hypothetical protein